MKQLKKYLNENGLRFNLTNKRIWKYFEEIFGLERAKELSHIFDEGYYEGINNIDIKYKFCKSFEEATALMYLQSELIFKSSTEILKNLTNTDHANILELGCYTGILSNFISENFKFSKVTGIDIEKNLIKFGNEKYNNKNLTLTNIDYENLKNLNNKFDYIFTNLGIEEIPHLKLDTYEIRKNNNYKSQLRYFSNFFSYLDDVSINNTEFLCIIRMNIDELISIIDGAQSQGWKWISDDLGCIDINSEKIPKIRFKKEISDKIDINIFLNETLKLKNKEESSLYQILEYENEKKNLKLLNKDSFKYTETNDELFYEIHQFDDLITLFAWTTLGYVKYKKFNDKKELVNFFNDEHGLVIDPQNIN